jgi:hypothetical protein
MAAALRCEIFPADLGAVGLRDFRLPDPSGYYWRGTGRAA